MSLRQHWGRRESASWTPACQLSTKSPHQWTEPGSSIIFTTTNPSILQRKIAAAATQHHVSTSLQHLCQTAAHCSQRCTMHSMHLNPTTPTHQLNPNTTINPTSTIAVVFWASEGTNPAHSLRILLIRAGIETNPGPPLKSSGGYTCESCGNTVNRGPPHFKCAKKCGKTCHIKTECSGISRANRNGASWLCSEHKPTSHASSPPSLPQPLPPQATPHNVTCPQCSTNLQKSPMICTRCNSGYHQACCGLANRYVIKRSRSSWLCPPCLNPSEPTPQTSQPLVNHLQASQPVDAIEPATAQIQQSSSSHSPKPQCLTCGVKVTKSFLTCNECGGACHLGQKCSDLPTRGAIENAKKNNDWICHTCIEKNRPPDNPPSTDEDITQKSEPKSSDRLNRPLRFLQWNARGINTKTSELKCFLNEYKIDVALIQETKLVTRKKKKSKSPIIPGYTVIRGDRKGAEYAGGGLITLVKEKIGYKSNGHSQRGPVELLSVSIHQSGKRWLTVNNTYIPEGEMDLSWIPVEPNSK